MVLEQPFPSAPTSVLLAEAAELLLWPLPAGCLCPMPLPCLVGCLGILPSDVGCVDLRGAERLFLFLGAPGRLMPGSEVELGPGQLPLGPSLS